MDYWSNFRNYAQKPKNWKFVSRLIYSSYVNVYSENKYLGKLILKYKIIDRINIDREYMDMRLISLFNKKISYEIDYFKRDKSSMIFVKNIFLDEKTYNQYIRKIKLKNILND